MAGWPLPETATVDGLTVRWAAMGDGPPVVLMHGTPFSSYEWHRIAPLLAQGRRVFVYDMPGYGRSIAGNAGADVSLGVQNRVLAGLFAEWGLGGPDNAPDVVAHDFGGATALRAALIDGLAYRTLTLVDAVALRPWGSPLVRHVREHEAAFAGMPGYMHQAILPPYIRSALGRPIADAALAPHVAPWLGAAGQTAFYRQIALMDQAHTAEVEDRLGTLGCPVQVLWGEADGWLPIDQGRALAAATGARRFVAVPGAGHLMQEDAPEAIVASLLDFLPAA
ncbi:MAG: alpha/beta fold hydrolase [Alphaproteobacteria bacterium]|nr:alpha/beta fold hydrolase [Alphaproteobacteria bacterium]